MEMTPEQIDLLLRGTSTGCLIFIAGFVAKMSAPIGQFLVRRMELRVQERKDERDGYGPLIDAMRLDMTAARGEMSLLREALQRCEEKHLADGARIAELEATVSGLERAVRTQATYQGVLLPATTPGSKPHALELAARTAEAALDEIDRQRSAENEPG